ncbi:hypothetical protein HY468_00390 [Candidatus Roizmanbacteria bacterium]|nr:hypothetical protein [Candidatus Roizmanbacteria bacterium]
MPLLILILFVALGVGTAGMVQQNQELNLQTGNIVSTASCYNVESDVTREVSADEIAGDCAEEVSGKTYVRIRQGVKIVNAKIGEGRKNWGTCTTTEPTGYGALRKINNNTLSSTAPGDIFWEDLNYTQDDLKEFLLILTEQSSTNHTFDIYVNESRIDELPEFVTNCKETGGIVSMLEGPATNTFPPQAISLTDTDYNSGANQIFDSTCCTSAFTENRDAGYYQDFFIRIQEKQKPGEAKKVGQLTKTINDDKRTYDVFFHAGIIYMTDTTDGSADKEKTWMYNGTSDEPPLGTGWHNPSLQLNTLKFVTTSEWTWATPECKPALYLYPEKETQLSVKVLPQGHLTESIPPHGVNGWNVTAFPDGRIYPFTQSPNYPITQSYPYLYYEAALEKVAVPKDQGWIKTKDELPAFFHTILPELGLNEKEAQDFKDYWLPKLTTEGTKWYITLIERDELDRVEPIQFSTQPDTFIRVRFYFEKLDNQSPIHQVTLSPIHPFTQSPVRSGFTVVDWGGIMGNGSCGVGEVSE